MLATNPHFDFEGSSSIPCTDASNPFRYVPPSFESIQEKGKGKMKKGDMNIKSYLTPSSPSDAHGPQASRSHMQPTFDDHWKKELREIACDYIARWWYDAISPSMLPVHHIMSLCLMPYMLLEKASKALLCMS